MGVDAHGTLGKQAVRICVVESNTGTAIGSSRQIQTYQSCVAGHPCCVARGSGASRAAADTVADQSVAARHALAGTPTPVTRARRSFCCGRGRRTTFSSIGRSRTSAFAAGNNCSFERLPHVIRAAFAAHAPSSHMQSGRPLVVGVYSSAEGLQLSSKVQSVSGAGKPPVFVPAYHTVRPRACPSAARPRPTCTGVPLGPRTSTHATIVNAYEHLCNVPPRVACACTCAWPWVCVAIALPAVRHMPQVHAARASGAQLHTVQEDTPRRVYAGARRSCLDCTRSI